MKKTKPIRSIYCHHGQHTFEGETFWDQQNDSYHRCGSLCACWCHRLPQLNDRTNELLIVLYNEGWLEDGL